MQENTDRQHPGHPDPRRNLDKLSVIAAGFQTAGRGQRGNKWLSEAWENLTFSILWQLPTALVPANRQFDLSKIATLAVHDYLNSRGVACKIKWPNDIYVGDRKICGMLIENSLTGSTVRTSIIGIGLNVNQTVFDPALMNPTSMKKVTGKTYDIKKELPDLMKLFCAYLDRYTKDGSAVIDPAYLSQLYRLDEIHDYRDLLTDDIIQGKIVGISGDGQLEMEIIQTRTSSDVASAGEKTASPAIRRFGFKEIGYLL